MKKYWIAAIVFVLLVFQVITAEAFIIFCFCATITFLCYELYIILYFKSEKFITIKNSIEEHTKKCNELNNHIEDLKEYSVNVKSYDYGKSKIEDNSNFNFKRKEWSKNLKNKYIHHCSSTVCKNAQNQPFKYLCKYFNIKVNENSLEKFENVFNNFSSVEQGKKLLENERNRIVNSVKDSIPELINIFSKKKLIDKLGFENIDLSNLYVPVYSFQYVSAGGNSSFKCEIPLDTKNLEKFINYLDQLIKYKNSIVGQRALMTSKLREKIKIRDNYTCQNCGLSIKDEENLLLEIDHVIPLSKGGITSEDNLQTLCWKCNRSKGAKIMEDK